MALKMARILVNCTFGRQRPKTEYGHRSSRPLIGIQACLSDDDGDDDDDDGGGGNDDVDDNSLIGIQDCLSVRDKSTNAVIRQKRATICMGLIPNGNCTSRVFFQQFTEHKSHSWQAHSH